MYVAIGAVCGNGSLADRMSNATISALIRLNNDDLEDDADLQADLRYVLQCTAHNHDGGKINKLPDELELKKLIEKMPDVMLETRRAD